MHGAVLSQEGDRVVAYANRVAHKSGAPPCDRWNMLHGSCAATFGPTYEAATFYIVGPDRS